MKMLQGNVLVTEVEKEKTTAGGIILISKDGTESAVRPRWFQVYSVGDDIDWLTEGAYVLVDHGRWSNGMKVDNGLFYSVDIGSIQVEDRTASFSANLTFSCS